jgi:hypothetical protein
MVGKSISEKQADKRKEEAQKEQKWSEVAVNPSQETWAEMAERFKKEAQQAKEGSLDGEITAILQTTAGEVYGDKAKDAERPVMSVHITCKDGKEFTETFSMPSGASSWRNKDFKLGNFLNKYGNLPMVGMPVKVMFNDEGFYRLNM